MISGESYRLRERKRAGITLPGTKSEDQVGQILDDRPGPKVGNFSASANKRYERGSIILANNKGFSERSELAGDETLASAILDRLLHRATTITISGASYRLNEKALASSNPPTVREVMRPSRIRHTGREKQTVGADF